MIETIDYLAMATSVRRHGEGLRREDGHVMRRALNLAVEGQRNGGRRVHGGKRWRKKVEEGGGRILRTLVSKEQTHSADQSETLVLIRLLLG